MTIGQSLRRGGLGDLRSPLREWILRLTGISWALFFVASVPMAKTRFAHEHDSVLGQLASWGAGGFEYIVMLAAINAGLGICLAIAAGNPVKFRAAIDVFLVCQTLHIASMAVMASVEPHRMHWVGDVPLGIGVIAVVAAVWLPVRSLAYQQA